VALKVIREEYVQDLIQRKRFLNEGHLVDRLAHPNIVKVFERGEYQQTLYIAMELLSGNSLAEIIRSRERLPLTGCLRILEQLADALAQLHGQGIVHRDIKPENVLLLRETGDPFRVKLLDFGLARDQSLTRLTETGQILGTIAYMAPEQITERLVSPAGDIYALGVVLYELLTLEKPFLGETPAEIIRAILETPPLEPARFHSALPVAWNRLVLSMLSKAPAQRPTADLLLEMLSALPTPGETGVAVREIPH
jgi:serine/threonine-protein kinase